MDVNNKISLVLPTLAEGLEQVFNNFGRGVLFSLVVFPEGRLQYVSNAKREDVQLAFEGLIARWKANPEDKPHHLQATDHDQKEMVLLPDGSRRLWTDIQQALAHQDIAGQILADTAEELGCVADNEVILQSIADKNSALALAITRLQEMRPVRVPDWLEDYDRDLALILGSMKPGVAASLSQPAAQSVGPETDDATQALGWSEKGWGRV